MGTYRVVPINEQLGRVCTQLTIQSATYTFLNGSSSSGSGDVFGAVFIIEKVLGSSTEEAIRSANKWAGRNTVMKGVFELIND